MRCISSTIGPFAFGSNGVITITCTIGIFGLVVPMGLLDEWDHRVLFGRYGTIESTEINGLFKLVPMEQFRD